MSRSMMWRQSVQMHTLFRSPYVNPRVIFLVAGRALSTSAARSDGIKHTGGHGHYTPITKQLWLDRMASVSRHAEDTIDQPITRKAPEVTEVTYPFSLQPALKELYRNPWNFIRIGCILEDLDSLAGNVAFQHCSRPGSPPPLLVTASVDEIKLHRPISIEHDVTVTGQVVWTGKSSLDIQMQLWQDYDQEQPSAAAAGAPGSPCAAPPHHCLPPQQPQQRQPRQPSLAALFSFVHLDPTSKRPSQVIQLVPETERDKAVAAERQALADARRSARQANAGSGIMGAVHAEARLWMAPLLAESRTLLELPSLAASDAVPISASALENTFITQPQQQNMHGRVFGGFLMRRAYELAFATTYMFAGARPAFVMVDEVSFKKPVDIGDLLRLKSRVLHTEVLSENEGRLFVEVEASVTKPEKLTIANTNTFTFVFATCGMSGPVKRVLPSSEAEAIRAYECSVAAADLPPAAIAA